MGDHCATSQANHPKEADDDDDDDDNDDEAWLAPRNQLWKNETR